MDYEKELKNKILNGEILTDKELQYVVFEFKYVDELEGYDHRWQREITTIVDIDGQLYAIEWMRGLTEDCENEFFDQPYKVECVETICVKKEYHKI